MTVLERKKLFIIWDKGFLILIPELLNGFDIFSDFPMLAAMAGIKFPFNCLTYVEEWLCIYVSNQLVSHIHCRQNIIIYASFENKTKRSPQT